MKGYEELKKQRTNLIFSKYNDKNKLLQGVEKQIDDYINNTIAKQKTINETEKKLMDIATKVYLSLDYQYAKIIVNSKLPKKLKKRFNIKVNGYALLDYNTVEISFLLDNETQLHINVSPNEISTILKEVGIDVGKSININEWNG